MKQTSVLSVLMFLFKHHMEDSIDLDEPSSQLMEQLQSIGFSKQLIYKAFEWLSNLEIQSNTPMEAPSVDAFRVLAEHEKMLLDDECQSYILTLEEMGILKPVTREMMLNQVLELAEEGIDISLIRWVTLMVLFNQPDEDQALQAMEFLVLDTTAGGVH